MRNLPLSQQLTIQQGRSRAKKAVKQGGQTRRSNKAVKQGGQTRRSNKAVKQGGQTRRSNKAVKQGGQTRRSNKVKSPMQWNSTMLSYSNNLTTPSQKKMLRELQKELPQTPSMKEKMSSPPQDEIDALVNLYHSGQMIKAEQTCRELLNTYPQTLIAINILGAALQGQGKLQEAVQAYDKAIQLKPDFAEAYSNRGNTLKELGQLDEVLKSCDKAIEIKPDYADAHYNRHALLLNPNDLMPAIKNMEKAVDIDPLNMLFRFVLGMLWDYSGDTQKATTHFDMVESGESLYRARLDAWRYIKSANKKVPTIIGSNIHAFKLGI